MWRWLVVLGVCLASSASAEEYEVGPQYPDLIPGDGFFEAGSPVNPYVARQEGVVWGTLAPRTPDLIPGDGFFEAGSSVNPYILTTE